MPLKIYTAVDGSSDGEFDDLTINDNLSTENLFAESAFLEQAHVTLANYSENTTNLTISSYQVVVDFTKGNTFTLNLTSSVDSFVLTNVPGDTVSFTIVVYQDTTAPLKNINWSFSGNVLRWASFSAPLVTQTLSAEDIYSFASFLGTGNSERVWYGFVGGQNFLPVGSNNYYTDMNEYSGVSGITVNANSNVSVSSVTYYYQSPPTVGSYIYYSPYGSPNNIARIAIQFTWQELITDYYIPWLIQTNSNGQIISKTSDYA